MTEFMTSDLSSELVAAVQDPTNLRAAFARINDVLESRGYTIVETNTDKPWGAYTRISSDEADRFIGVFPFGVDPAEAPGCTRRRTKPKNTSCGSKPKVELAIPY